MRPVYLSIFLLLMCSLIFAQKKSSDYLLLHFDTSYYDNYCYLNKKGDTVIKAGKYSICYTDTFYNNAIVFSEEEGLVMIDRDENIKVHVFPFDNGPDYFSEGLLRVVDDGLIGYADKNGEIKIEPRFECAFPFHEGRAAFCSGGILVNDGKHSWWDKAKWGAIDIDGNMVIRPQYDSYFEFHEGRAVVEKGEEVYEIDLSGNRIN